MVKPFKEVITAVACKPKCGPKKRVAIKTSCLNRILLVFQKSSTFFLLQLQGETSPNEETNTPKF